MTPMQEQYNKIKAEYSDCIILFRLGDFYEAFNEDAEILSKVLGITLTGRGKEDTRTPMAGIPYHALPNYLPKLVEAGLKIAIAEQMEEATAGKLVERKVTKIITPGTVIDVKSLDSSQNNYIASIFINDSKSVQNFALVFSDLTTGELKGFESTSARLISLELNKISPKELLCLDSQKPRVQIIFKGFIQELKINYFDKNENVEILKNQFGVSTLKGFGIGEDSDLVQSCAALISYLRDCQKTELRHIKTFKKYNYSSYMNLDPETIRNLELIYPMNGAELASTLYGVLCSSVTSMGKRTFRQWILNPLINSEILNNRFESVDFFYKNRIFSDELREDLKTVNDIERIVGRIGIESANPKDLIALKQSLEIIQRINNKIKTQENLPERIRFITEEIRNLFEDNEKKLTNVISLIENTIDEDPSVLINNGGIIKQGFNSEVDELKQLTKNSKQILLEIQKKEIERTGINSLKISYNQVFGYYMEVTKSHLDKVPATYIRKQTLANAERFITEELKELGTKILTAEEKLIKLEQEIFINFRNQIAEYSSNILNLAGLIAEIDIVCNAAIFARLNNYCKPKIETSKKNYFEIINGRHPVVEKLTKSFIPNSTTFDSDSVIHILTGPNMSGKSTYIRQVALILLMAQIGFFVPADSFIFTISDRIFTRVGAADNLSRGESTFMVEMIETANILNNATENSLIILDEVGRGTSTYDGVAIAWSIVEFLVNSIKAKTLFATHYHELIALESSYSLIKNFNVEVEEQNGEISFHHKIISGSTNKSYGVHVASLAGVPKGVAERAKIILEKFESSNREGDSSKKTKSVPKPKAIHPEQLGLM